MPSVLLIVEPSSDASSLRKALVSSAFSVVSEITDPVQVHAELVRVAPDMIVACIASPDATLLDALRLVAEKAPRPVIMFANDARREVIRRTVDAGVAAYVVDGWAAERVAAIIEAACARFEAYESLKKELHTTRNKLAERKVVEKAKGLVMQQRGLSEEQAYSALRKMAMDQNLALAEVARRVISIAHLLA